MNPASRVRISEDASPFSRSVDYEAQKRMVLVDWINTLIPCACFSVKASNGELRAFLLDGVVLCQILSKLKPNFETEEAGSRNSLERLKKFLAVIAEMGLPGFEISDLEKGSMKPVLDCLYALKEKYMPNFAGSKFTCSPSSPVSTESQSGLLHGSHKFNEVFQMKQGIYSDLRVTRISEMVKSNSLDNAPTQSLLSVVNGILDESIERKNTEIPQRVACLLRKVVQEIERRLATQAEHLRIQNNLYKNREEKYQSRISVLETLAAGTNEETEMVMTELQRLKTQTGKKKLEDKKRSEDKEVHLGKKEKDLLESEISALKQELEISKKALEQRRLEPEQKTNNSEDREVAQLKKEKDQTETEISTLKRELEKLKKTYEQNRLEMEQEKNNVDKVIGEMKNDRDQSDPEISRFKQELERAKKMHDQRCHDMEVQRRNIEDEEITRLTKEKDQCNVEISTLKQELEMSRKTREQSILEMEQQKDNKGKEVAQVKNETHQSDPEISRLKQQLETAKRSYEQRFQDLEQRKSVEENEISQLTKAKDQSDFEISNLKQELEKCKKTYELRCEELETETKSVRSKLEQKLKEQEQLLEDSKHKMKEIRGNAELKCKVWMRKENVFQSFISNHGSALQELRNSSESTKLELVKAHKSYLQELSRIGEKFEGIATTANKYHRVLYENRKIYNELQDLKGNIRVYCRIRPFLPGQTKKDTVIDSIGDNGEVTIINPSKGKDSQKSFKFNKVFAPTSTQEEVFTDTQPLIRTILDGFNVCIFAYGQTGSGKTYTMTGPEGATKEDWGVNYRALDDLFQISEERKSCFHYSIGVQMVEIYNEQILDLLSSDNSQKKLGVLTGSQPNGIAVPDASMHTVQSTSDVIELMSLGHANRSVSSTAMNERSSRSHSVVTIHVQGTDLKSSATTHASLHLVDLAGSERVDRSEVTGDRLREAQHINKSLSALGDVIFALASKSNHVPYRNSKLTQVLQSSLGGRAKTLMFVQLNPDVTSFSETLSTLKFAERVSGVELGAARSNKEGRDVKELMEQVVSLKDMIAKKDEEIERLQLLKDPRSISSPLHSRRSANSLTNYGSHSPTSSVATDQEDYIDRNSDSGSTQLTDNDERLSEVSDGDVSVGTDGDETKETPVASRTSRNPEGSSDKTRTPRTRVPAATPPSRLSQVKTPVRAITALRKPASGTSSSVTPTSRREISRPSAAAATPSPRSAVDRPSPRSAVDRPSPRSAVDRPSPRSAVATPSRRVG